jgi:hypothetical protein
MAKQSTRMPHAEWQKHVNTQATSGLSQSDYCRAHQLNIKYFSFWKGKLRKAAKSAAHSDVNSIDLIPVVVKNTRNTKTAPSAPTTGTPNISANPSIYIDMKLTFPNGVVMELRLPNETALPPFITQLIQLPC